MRSEPLDRSADLVVVQEADAEPTIDPDVPAGSVVSVASPPAGKFAAFFGELPLALVISGVGVGLIVIAMHHFRWGNLAISMAVLAGALFRLVLPTRQAGLLVVRSRFTDVVTMGVVGGALMVLAAVTST
jgi:hypothetical protein